ncbi:MAG: hypothetical protein Q4C70_03260 [Planctomycetia bacterium]|nr:hypothetical protein [Planctomycetia bacterium]
MNRRFGFSFLFFILLAFFPGVALAWGGGHDAVVETLKEYLPAEVKAFFSEEDMTLMRKYCHYPDMPNKTLEETGEIVGAEDEALLRAFGYDSSNWLHGHTGRAATYVMLHRAFQQKDTKKAAFYLSVLSHSVSDQGAVNHTPILQFTTYSHFDGVDYGIKNSCEFRLTERLADKFRERFVTYQPRKIAETFTESVYEMAMDCYLQAEISAEIEVQIAFGTPEESETAMEKIVVAQIASLLDMTYTAWEFAKNGENTEEFTPKMLDEIANREATRRRQGNPVTQEVYAGIFDESLNPENPKATVGLVCEPFGSFHVRALSYVGKMLVASAGRTLRDNGYAVRGVSFWKMETEELPDPKEMPILLIFAGRCRISDEIAATIQRYTECGGKLFYVAGMDPKKLTGMTPYLKRRENHEIPVSVKWGIQNEELWGKMSVTFAPEMERLSASPYPLVRNPNFDGFCKPACIWSVEIPENKAENTSETARETVSEVIPLAWLDNGTETFCVAAKCGRTVWAPEYLFLPFLFSDVKTLRWSELRLDPFGEKVLLEMVEELLR